MDVRLKTFRDILTPIPRGSLIDLGAGHCKFSRVALDMGFDVVAFDAREERIPEDMKPLFVKGDVRDVDLKGFKVVCILGLLYHLELEAHEPLLNKCEDTVIVDTHISDGGAQIGKYKGVYREELQSMLTDALGTDHSFIHTEDSLKRLFTNCGFAYTKHTEHVPGRAFWSLTRC
jgi:hypothetical protein